MNAIQIEVLEGHLYCASMWIVAQQTTGLLAAELASKEPVLASVLKSELITLLPRLRRFAHTLTRSAPEADDLVQDVCLRALDNASKWDPDQPLDRWVFRMMRNHWISEVRKRKVRLGEGNVPADETNELTVDHNAEDQMAANELYGHVAALPSELSSVLLLVSVEGYSYAEAAELLDIPVGTIMSRMHRARKVLAQKIHRSAGAVH